MMTITHEKSRRCVDVYLLVGDEGPAPPAVAALAPSTFLGALAATAEIEIKDGTPNAHHN